MQLTRIFGQILNLPKVVNLSDSIMNKSINENIRDKIIKLVKNDWGFPFIVGFIVLLIVAAAFLSAGSVWSVSLAETLANFAYFALAAGVVLQIVCLTVIKTKIVSGLRKTRMWFRKTKTFQKRFNP